VRVRPTPAHEIERRPHVVHLARSVAELPIARARSSKVEAQHRTANAAECFRRLIHDFGVHRAAVLRVRVREHDRGAHARFVSGFEQTAVADTPAGYGLVEQRFEASCRSWYFTLHKEITELTEETATETTAETATEKTEGTGTETTAATEKTEGTGTETTEVTALHRETEERS
jgi:hypothetical protein